MEPCRITSSACRLRFHCPAVTSAASSFAPSTPCASGVDDRQPCVGQKSPAVSAGASAPAFGAGDRAAGGASVLPEQAASATTTARSGIHHFFMPRMIAKSPACVLDREGLTFPEARDILGARGEPPHARERRLVMKRLAYLAALAVITVVLLGGCAPGSSTPKSQKVVYLINGALGDNAFYDSGKGGIDAIARQYGVETRTIECNFDAAKYVPALQAAVNYADVIFVISYGYEDQLKEIADKNPSKVFVNIDTVVENSKKTITSVDYIAEESAYLAGVVAGMATTDASIKKMNKDKIVGVVGGDTDPVVSAFVFAYINGAKSVDPKIKVLTKSLGGAWDDSAKGKQAALQLFDQRADIVFQVAAAAGIGVLQAAKERGLYA